MWKMSYLQHGKILILWWFPLKLIQHLPHSLDSEILFQQSKISSFKKSHHHSNRQHTSIRHYSQRELLEHCPMLISPSLLYFVIYFHSDDDLKLKMFNQYIHSHFVFLHLLNKLINLTILCSSYSFTYCAISHVITRLSLPPDKKWVPLSVNVKQFIFW